MSRTRTRTCGATLAGALFGEIDRLLVKLGPLTLGSGISLLQKDFEPYVWRLTDHRPVGEMLLVTYDRAE